jgi:hypothetical protein
MEGCKIRRGQLASDGKLLSPERGGEPPTATALHNDNHDEAYFTMLAIARAALEDYEFHWSGSHGV